MKYLAVTINAGILGNLSDAKISREINKYAAAGWRLHSIQNISGADKLNLIVIFYM
ncbi:DUF4177 domain-containing protein [Mycoplasmatota bacterium zrk1]